MPQAAGRGVHDREILRLAVPAFGALVAEPLFLLADSAIVGHLGTPQLAGLGVAGSLLATAVSVCVFLAYGTTAAVARRVGAGDLRAAVAQGVDGIWLALVIGLLLAIGLALGGGRWSAAFGTGADATPYALTYLRVSLIGLPAMLVVLAATGVLRGLQDTRTPLVVAAAGAVAQRRPERAPGVRRSTWASPARRWAPCSPRSGWPSPSGSSWSAVPGARGRRCARTCPASGPRGAPGSRWWCAPSTLRAALLLMTYVATAAGTVAIAAHQVAFTIWLFLSLDARRGGDRRAGHRRSLPRRRGRRRAPGRRPAGWWSGASRSGVLLGLVLLALAAAFVPLFTEDPAVRSLLATVLIVAAVAQPVCGVVFALDGVLIGAGDGGYLAWAGIVTLVSFLPLALLVLVQDAGLVWLWWAFDAFLVVRLGTLVVRWRGEGWLVTGAMLPRRTGR